MSSGKTHSAVAVALMIPISAGAYYAWNAGYDCAPWLAVGGFAGWFLTSDADVAGNTDEDRRLWTIFPPFGYCWQVLLYPYALAFKHREISHWPLIGTVTRMVYLLLIAIGAIILINGVANLLIPGALFADPLAPLQWVSQNQECLVWMYAAWALQDFVHFVFDLVSTGLKHFAHRRHHGYRGRWRYYD